MGKSGKVDYFPVLKLILSSERKVAGLMREQRDKTRGGEWKHQRIIYARGSPGLL